MLPLILGYHNSNWIKIYHPIFEQYNIDLVIQGHSHNYQRSYPILYNDLDPSNPTISTHEQSYYKDPSGIIFVIVGTGGESIQSVDKRPYLASTYMGNGCINIQIKGKSLDAEYYSETKATVDHFVVIKDENLKKFSPELKPQKIDFSSRQVMK